MTEQKPAKSPDEVCGHHLYGNPRVVCVMQRGHPGVHVSDNGALQYRSVYEGPVTQEEK